MQSTMRVYQVRTRKDKRGVDLISDALPFGRLWYEGPEAARQCTSTDKLRRVSSPMRCRVRCQRLRPRMM